MPIRLILIAHAETSATRRGVFPSGESLDDRGQKAASQFAGTLPKADEVLASPAPAARETALALGIEARLDPALADIDVGTWAGRSVMEIGMQDAEAATAWLEDPTFTGHGGESFEQLIARIGGWLETRTATKGIAIAVTHAAVLRAAAIAALGAHPAAFWTIEAAPLAMLILGSDGRRWMLRELRQP